MGAAHALYRIPLDAPEACVDQALRGAEHLATKRAFRDGFEPAITRDDVEQAFREAGFPLGDLAV
jgi:hypothetical protein